LLALSHWLKPDVELLLRPRCYTCHAKVAERLNLDLLSIPADYSDVFLFHPRSSKNWQQSIKQHLAYRFVPIKLTIKIHEQSNNDKVLYRIMYK
jgi:hypothetical protein